MEINKVLEVLNNALADKDLTTWLQKEEIKRLKNELEDMRGKVNEQGN